MTNMQGAQSASLPVLSLSDPVFLIEHLALLLDCSVDRAREYAYRPDFPAARKLGAQPLWLATDVVTWVTELPPVSREQRRPECRPTRGWW